MMTVIEKQYMDAVIAMNRRLQSSQPDWEQRRYEIAKDAMCAILGNPAIVDKVTEEGEPAWGAQDAIAKAAVTLAGLHVADLKKQKSDD